nr:aminotransferase class III-fold pyridoxal phosphate-dependent enzyme [Deinobacterium chartae]
MSAMAVSGFIRADEVLHEQLSPQRALELDVRYGNADLLTALEILGVAGPFRAVTPWELEDPRGVRRIQAGGYAALPFGENYPPLTQFLAKVLEASRATGLPQQASSAWRAALQSNLIRLLSMHYPSHADSQVFFSNSGTEAIEGAIKFARAARPRAQHLISFNSAYHGKTLGSLSVTPNAEYQDMFRPLVPGAVTLPYGDFDALRAKIAELRPDNVTAVLVEPIQGEGGVITPPEGFLRRLGELCHTHGILVIADEIQTGLGRTGHWFESAAQGLDPDIITLAKPLGGGLVAVGATIARKWIFKKMLGGLASKRHSNTFGGNTVAMAVGLKSLEMLIDENLPERSRRLGELGLERLRRIQAAYPELMSEVRGAGLLLAMQFQPVLSHRLLRSQDELIKELSSILALRELHVAGVQANLSLSSKRVVRLTPALNMPEDLFATMFDRVEAMARHNPQAWRMLARTPPGVLLKLGSFALRS